jgi:hypothetical protein
MRSIPVRAVLFALIGLVALGSVISVKPGTISQVPSDVAAGACVETGVTLVIEFSDEPNETLVKCVKDFSGSGWQIFEAAEQVVTGTAEYPQSFVCRINQWPPSALETCQRTPDYKTGTWVYFNASVANDSGNWLRSGQGAAAHKPKCGDYEGWRFVTETNSSQAIPKTVARPFECKQ